jgi:penicillin-binding protein 1A
MEMATGFAVFANGGSLVTPYFIDSIYAADGSLIEQATPRIACPECGGYPDPTAPPVLSVPEGATAAELGGGMVPPAEEETAPRAISEANAWIITDLLRDVVRRGTGQRARALGREDLAGKTGTTNEGRDAWFSGFNPDVVATAWIGFDQERSLGAGEEGSKTALPMWIYFMREALGGRPEHRLPMPDGVVTARVNFEATQFGEEMPATSAFEYFLADHLPAGVEGTTDESSPTSPSQRYEEPIF